MLKFCTTPKTELRTRRVSVHTESACSLAYHSIRSAKSSKSSSQERSWRNATHLSNAFSDGAK